MKDIQEYVPSFRIISHVGLLIAAIMFTGCDGILDKQPVGMITDSQVWNDQALVESYILDVYDRIDFIGGRGNTSYNQMLIPIMGAELTTNGSWQAPAQAGISVIDGSGVPGILARWDWPNIRRANSIIENLQNTEFDEEFVRTRTAELRFLRAFEYFRLVKRYGGVPLITRAQSLDDPPEEIFLPRNSEQEIYDFIASEVDAIVPDLPLVTDPGRVTKGAALALKSRAMLYAGSIAKFGSIQLDGLLGIPASEAEKYFQASYDASRQIIDLGIYGLYDENPDPVENFRELFVTELAANKEAIFGEIFDGVNKGHSYTFMAIPEGPNRGWGSNFFVFYEIVELFDFMDGSSGRIPRDELVSREWSSEELFGTRDPRFRASCYYPEIYACDQPIYFHSSTFVDGEQVSSGTIGDGWPAASSQRTNTVTGVLVRKRVDESQIYLAHDQDETDYIVFRLGEIYLNLAEAAFYLGKNDEALGYLNAIRERAGMPARTEITEEFIRHERQVELAFEGHRYWDLRRWRIAVEKLDGLRTQGLRYDYNWDTKKYKISFVNGEGRPRTFQERHYYLPLGANRVAENPNLVENPGY